MPVMQITRTSEAGKSPVSGSLLPGQLAVEMGTPTRLWVGVTAADDALLQKKLYDSSMAFIAEPAADSITYGRQTITGVGSDWKPVLPITGGTLTGPLTIDMTWAFLRLKNPAGQTRAIIGSNSPGGDRWQVFIGDNTTESGSNNGSDFSISRYDDAGTILGKALSIKRSTGVVDFTFTPTVAGAPMGGGGMAEPTGAGTWARKETGVWERGVAIVGDEMAGELRFMPLGSGIAVSQWGIRADAVAGGTGRKAEITAGGGKTGGSVSVNGGNGTGGNGGQSSLSGGSSDTFAGGNVVISGGNAANGQGGQTNIRGGDGLMAGSLSLNGGSSTKNNGLGEMVTIGGGDALTGLGTGGGVNIHGGIGNGVGGLVFIVAGDSASEGGPVTIQGGTATAAAGTPGNIVLTPGRNALDTTKFGNVIIPNLPTAAPAVANALWRDPVTNALMITP